MVMPQQAKFHGKLYLVMEINGELVILLTKLEWIG